MTSSGKFPWTLSIIDLNAELVVPQCIFPVPSYLKASPLPYLSEQLPVAGIVNYGVMSSEKNVSEMEEAESSLRRLEKFPG